MRSSCDINYAVIQYESDGHLVGLHSWIEYPLLSSLNSHFKDIAASQQIRTSSSQRRNWTIKCFISWDMNPLSPSRPGYHKEPEDLSWMQIYTFYWVNIVFPTFPRWFGLLAVKFLITREIKQNCSNISVFTFLFLSSWHPDWQHGKQCVVSDIMMSQRCCQNIFCDLCEVTW